MMIERVLFDIIRDGIAFLVANPDALTEFFVQEGNLELAEAEKISAYFQKSPPTVIHSYPRIDAKFPCYAITLTAEGHDKDFLGRLGGMDSDPESESYGAEEWAAIFSEGHTILVCAQNPDVVLYNYYVLRKILIDNYRLLERTAHLHDIQFSGSDLAPDPTWGTAGLFIRRLTVSSKQEYTQTLDSTKVGRAWKVAVHITREGAPGEDIGGVFDGVTFGPGEDEVVP